MTADDMRAVVGKLVAMAKGGDVAATRELLPTTLGWPMEPNVLERLEALVAQLGGQEPRRAG